MSLAIFIPLPFFIILLFSIVVQAVVPANKTFIIVNEGNYGDYDDEYGSNYRLVNNAEYDFQENGFALCFYNTTPSAYTLGLRMGSRPEDSTSNIMRWVWDANRGNPVGENATLSFGTNGNLVLADANGRLAWQTDTANKGVVGISLLPNGNLVLQDNRGRFVWQSFSYPTDTLLVGQGLSSSGTTELISRVSNVDGSKGPYSIVLEKQRLVMYLKSKNSPKPILYHIILDQGGFDFINSVNFNSAPETEEAFVYNLNLDYYVDNSTTPFSTRLARPKYNSILSFLRVESDGNLRIHTYYDKVISGSWEVTYTLFNREGSRSVSECRLPTKCRSYGVCLNNNCVGCPSPEGIILAWSETCASPTLPPCKNRSPPVKASYYKVVGVEHFTRDYTEGEGPVKVSECRGKCNQDCGCLGFFYREESSKCLIAYELGTLTKVANQSHVAYIKMYKEASISHAFY
ncbi:Ep1-like glycoprotein [Thalictrum thalictroides]|uniref:Ep1-like glycoprotein n=1 Tax=Thalictrum thalictroides TaxID=46969 RepID=A0A7J6UTI3_THATH|nr:Ep1-like glycoprotein [Thalictrum thalictroides]